MFIIYFFFCVCTSTKKTHRLNPRIQRKSVEILFLCDPRTIRGQINVRLKGAAAINASGGAVRMKQNGTEVEERPILYSHNITIEHYDMQRSLSHLIICIDILVTKPFEHVCSLIFSYNCLDSTKKATEKTAVMVKLRKSHYFHYTWVSEILNPNLPFLLQTSYQTIH